MSRYEYDITYACEVLLVPADGALLSRLDLPTAFDLALAPDPSLATGAALPDTALHAGPGDVWIAPTRSDDPSAAREMLRQLFSRSGATRFAADNQLVSVVRGALPASPGPSLSAQLMLLGGLAVQLKEIAKGNDPRPMDSAEFWLAAVMQGGGLGIFGDFFSASTSRTGAGRVAEV